MDKHQLHAFYKNSIGLNSVLSTLLDTNKKEIFLPYNIVKLDESSFRLDLAIAGYSKEGIQIEKLNDRLTIYTKQIDQDGPEPPVYLYQGISNRHFRFSWIIPEHSELSASTDNGILSVYISVRKEKEVGSLIPIK